MKRPLFISVIYSSFASIAEAQAPSSPFLLGGEYQLEADVDDGGSFTRAVVETRVSAPLFIGEDSLVALSVSYQFESFNFNGFLDDPWGDLNRTDISLVGKQDFASGWSWIAAAFIGADNENDADFDDSLTGGGALLAYYEFNDRLTLGLGLRVKSNLDDNLSILPFPIIDWEFAENWSVTTVPPDGFSVGPGVSLQWDAREDLTLALAFQYQSDETRLADNAPAGFEERIDGLGEFRQGRAALVAAYEFSENLNFTAHVGLTLAGEIEISDDQGDKLEESDFDTSLVFGFEGSYSF